VPWGKKYFCAPTPTEIAEFEMKNRCKIAKEAKAEHLPVYCCCIFNVRNGADQAILLAGSNNTGVWGRSPAGVPRQSPQRCGDFTAFYTKNTHF